MHPRQKFTGRLLVTVQEAEFMDVTLRFQGLIPQPAVRMHSTARFNGFLHKGAQTLGRSVGYSSHPDPPNALSILLSCHHNQGLVLSLTAAGASLRIAEIRFRPPPRGLNSRS